MGRPSNSQSPWRIRRAEGSESPADSSIRNWGDGGARGAQRAGLGVFLLLFRTATHAPFLKRLAKEFGSLQKKLNMIESSLLSHGSKRHASPRCPRVSPHGGRRGSHPPGFSLHWNPRLPLLDL